ncbi:MAG: polyketide synthase, partial [Duganella sp.]
VRDVPAAKPVWTLPPLPAAADETTCEIGVTDHGDGVYALDMLGVPARWSEALVQALAQAFHAVSERVDASALIVRGGARFLPVDGAQAFFSHGAALLPLDCPIPVVAAVEGDAQGPAWLFAALCDFMLCAEEGHYGHGAPVTGAEAALYQERFRLGDPPASLTTDAARSGLELRAAGLGPAVLPRDQVGDAALALARQLAAAPRISLSLLKHHLAQDLKALAGALPDHIPATDVRVPETPAGTAQAWDGLLACAAPPAAERSGCRMLDTGSQVVSLDIDDDGVAVIALRDPGHRNAFTDALVDGVSKAFAAVAALPQAKVLVLTGDAGYFSTGGTRASLLAIQSGQARFTDIDIYGMPATLAIPVIAAMQGHAVGAGWALGMFCDIVVCSAQHTYSSPYMQYGFTPGAGATLVFPARLGRDLGHEILYCARQYSGEELRARGAPCQVVAAAEVLPRALSLAAQLARHERSALAAVKRDVNAGINRRRDAIFAQEQAMHQQSFVGSAEVLARIGRHFGDMAPDDAIPHASVPAHDTEGGAHDLLPALRTTLAAELLMQADEIDQDQKFIDIGLDSITGVNWVRKINQQYALAVNATAIYRHPTLREFARYLRELCAGAALPSLPALSAAPVMPAAPVARPAPVKLCTIRPARASVAVTSAPSMPQAVEPAAVQPAAVFAPASASASAPAPATALPAMPKIAVIGMAGRFPKARDLDQFWRNLAAGRDCIDEVPADRWRADLYFDADREQPGKTYSRWMGCLDDVAMFDPLFFGISPREAEWMDPQQRVFLQSAWHCVEDAGYGPELLAGSRCGVFVGCTAGDYSQEIARTDLNAQNFMGRASAILASRIAYLLDLQGPCMAIDTACSSSLVAMASACDSLASGACDMALAGGVCVLAGPDMHIMTSKAGMLSPDGRCHTFDQRANGFVPGEGVAAVMLKRLDDAIRDGDRIDGVIGGWGVNQDGKTNGMTAPNPQSQARLQQDIYRKFGIDPGTIVLVETHGTGTRLGDPIEVEGLKEAFGAFTERAGYCALGSVKSNIGHTLAAAGIAGAVKLLLALKHQAMPPTLHVEQVNPHIELEGSPFFINRTVRPWLPEQGKTRRAAVSSFGFSGTNAHLVIEEFQLAEPASASASAPTAPAAGPHAVVLSARSTERLAVVARRLLDFIDLPGHDTIELADLAYTLQVGREAMAARLALEAHTLPELRSALMAAIGALDRGEAAAKPSMEHL